MLNDIQAVISDPENIPDIPNASAQYLKVRCNASYLIRTGVIDDLRKAGFSENHILGFIDGLNAVTEIIELMQEQRDTPPEED
ncbi:phage protein [Pseudomonas rhodesiae]|uniref:phage protein n=1 Tax=Pseudomonas rhodesiae TaxID=76760 RepID=UPI002B1DAB09|nr:phage protein [Pseudomonas rhodesiae]